MPSGWTQRRHPARQRATIDAMTRADDLLTALLRTLGDWGQVRHIEHLPARTARTAPWPAWCDPGVVEAYQAAGIAELWQHQYDAAEAIHRGQTTAIATATGSGKSLGFWLPILSTIAAGKREAARATGLITAGRPASALYLAPTKALAADQHLALRRLVAASPSLDTVIDTCDGDTPREARDWIRGHSDVVLTNPDFLHHALLPQHQRWTRFLRSLRYVVIDEGHAYRGLFGAHLALVLRRLMRIRAHYSDAPREARDEDEPALTFVIASATTADPTHLASLLTGTPGEEVAVIAQDSAPSGARTVVMWQPPPVVDSDADAAVEVDGLSIDDALTDGSDDLTGLTGIPGQGSLDEVRRSATVEAAHVTAALVENGARLLTFTRSRRGAETVASVASSILSTRGGVPADSVSAYRGGYLPEERRALESAMSSGQQRALATTNALELGIDISGLDAVAIAGWPGSRASVWQQAGRAGRAGATGLVLFISRQDPLDNYLLDHPESLFSQSVEATVLDPANRYVLAPHLCAAAAELPLTEADLALFDPSARALLDEITTAGLLRKRGSENGPRWFWTRPEPASALADLRGAGTGTVTITEADSGQVIGTMSAEDADSALHTGAVYVHQGRSFHVVEYLPDELSAMVVARAVDFHTWARSTTEMRVVEQERAVTWQSGAVEWCYGSVEVTSQVVEFQRLRNSDRLVLGNFPLELPERVLSTSAVWWTMSAAVLERAGIDASTAPGALHAAEHAAIGVLPLLATCDRSDIGGLSTAWHDQTERATIFIHDGAPGGAGFSERAFQQADRWIEATVEVISQCSCRYGCPACVQSPKCGNGNHPLDKAAALRLLRVLLESHPGTDPALRV